MHLDLLAIKRFMAKEEAGAYYVYKKTYPLLFRLCFDVLGQKQDAEDAALDAYVKVLESQTAFANANQFLSYLCVSAKNLALNLAKSRREIMPLEEEMVGDNEPKSIDEALLNKVREILGEEDFELLKLHSVDNLSFPVIANIQGGSASSCRGRYFRALKKLRASLPREELR